ncbi:flagellar hook-basal body complex protein [Aquicoccus sp. SCR17]|nr:flagellar hook-basal body complex protein [Carideicomes alvinocaridis]
MSISNAMQTGISGLLANSTTVGNISSNIANANTDGYRRSFSQMVTSASSGGQGATAAGVRAVQRADVSLGGTQRTTGVNSDLAVSGAGFFVVSRNPNDPVQANYAFTRAGSFRVDDEGNLSNAAGLYLSGFKYDNAGTLGTVVRNQFDNLETVNVGNTTINGEATTSMSVKGNLPAQETGAGSTSEPFVTSQEYYTALGAAERLEFAWTPSTTPNVWTLGISAEGTELGTVDITFDDYGPSAGAPLSYGSVTALAPAPGGFAFDTGTGTATLTIDNGTTPQVIEVSIGAPGSLSGMTQFDGDYTPLQAEANGLETGKLTRFEIEDNGDLYGIFDNNSRRLLYNIPLAEIPNPDGMRAIDGNAFITTQASGEFHLSEAKSGTAGSIASGSLEASNVELVEELTDLIQTQRAYSSNAKIITTADELMDETTRLKR